MGVFLQAKKPNTEQLSIADKDLIALCDFSFLTHKGTCLEALADTVPLYASMDSRHSLISRSTEELQYIYPEISKSRWQLSVCPPLPGHPAGVQM